MENTAQGGHVERQIQHEVKPSAVFFVHMSLGGALIVI